METNLIKKEKLINISKKVRAFVWTPQRTASTLASEIFKVEEFGFSCYHETGEKKSTAFCHNHFYKYFEGHEEYDFIITIRNPYIQYLSLLGYNSEKFEYYERIFQSSYHTSFIDNLKKRRPNYVIRVENVYEDYLKIPFVKKSILNKTGELKKIIDKVIKNNPGPVADYKKGKETALGFLVGQVMKETRGQANPSITNKLLKDLLK